MYRVYKGPKKEGIDVRRRRRRKGEKREQPTKEGEMLTESSKQIGTIAVGREGRIGKRFPFLPFRFKAVESKVPACVCVCVIKPCLCTAK